MLIRHTALYTIARGLPGLINFLALALYTRLLARAEYGTYALVIAWVGVANALLFQWLRSAARRFLPGAGSELPALQGSLMSGFALLMLPTAAVAGLAMPFLPEPGLRWLVLLGLLLLWLQAFFELTLELVLAGLQPRRYGVLALTRAITALTIGGLLAWAGLGPAGVLLGLMAGILLPLAGAFRREWRGVHPGLSDPEWRRTLVRYGLPLSATFILDYVINSSDRLFLAHLHGTAAVGTYAVAYDLSQQGLYALMLVVYLAGFPLAVRALETGGEPAARQQLGRHATLLLAIALPAAVGLSLLAGNVAHVLLGAEFREGATVLIPWVAAAALCAGLKAYYFDLSFQLGRNTLLQLGIAAAGALLNVVLNLLWIPRLGALGAAYSTLVSFAVALGLSATIGRSAFRMPVPAAEWMRIALAAGVMGAALWPLLDRRGPVALAMQVGLGALLYGVAALSLDVAGVRGILAARLRVSRST